MGKKIRLNLGIVTGVYKRILSEKGYASCAMVAAEMAKMGFISPRTGKSFTRQAIHYVLIKEQEGRDLLCVTNRRIGRS